MNYKLHTDYNCSDGSTTFKEAISFHLYQQGMRNYLQYVISLTLIYFRVEKVD